MMLFEHPTVEFCERGPRDRYDNDVKPGLGQGLGDTVAALNAYVALLSDAAHKHGHF